MNACATLLYEIADHEAKRAGQLSCDGRAFEEGPAIESDAVFKLEEILTKDYVVVKLYSVFLVF
jgi:hypothetical protein